MADVIPIRKNTYSAKLFEVLFDDLKPFKVAGTLDGFVDFATPMGGPTYPLSLDEARQLVAALNSAIHDVETNCLYERDALLCS